MGQTELDRLEALLRKYNYIAPKKYALRLQDEGMGDFELEYRLSQDRESLRRTHNMLRAV